MKLTVLFIFIMILTSCKLGQSESAVPKDPVAASSDSALPKAEEVKPKIEISVNKEQSFSENEAPITFKVK